MRDAKNWFRFELRLLSFDWISVFFNEHPKWRWQIFYFQITAKKSLEKHESGTMFCTQGEQELGIRCTTFVRSICTITEQHSSTGPLRKPSYGDRSRCKCCQWHLAGIMWCSEKEMHLNFAIRVFIIGDGVRIWLTIAWSWIMTFIRWRRFTFIGNHFSFWSKRSTVIYIDPSGSFQYIYIAYSRSCRFESSLHSIKNESLDSCRTNGVRCPLKHAALKPKAKKKEDNYCTWARSSRALPSTNPGENFHQL